MENKQLDELTQEEVDFVLSKTDNLLEYSAEPWNKDNSVRKHIYSYKDKIEENIKGKTAIELGPADNPFFIGEPSEYIGVDPFSLNINSLKRILNEEQSNPHFDKLRKEKKLKAVLNDAYSFLKKWPDNSAIIYSFGLFDVANQIGGRAYGKENNIVEKYVQSLANQILRVTPNNGITFHVGINFSDYFIKAGFLPLEFDYHSCTPSTFGLFYMKNKIIPGTSLINPLDSKEIITANLIDNQIKYTCSKNQK